MLASDSSLRQFSARLGLACVERCAERRFQLQRDHALQRGVQALEQVAARLLGGEIGIVAGSGREHHVAKAARPLPVVENAGRQPGEVARDRRRQRAGVVRIRPGGARRRQAGVVVEDLLERREPGQRDALALEPARRDQRRVLGGQRLAQLPRDGAALVWKQLDPARLAPPPRSARTRSAARAARRASPARTRSRAACRRSGVGARRSRTSPSRGPRWWRRSAGSPARSPDRSARGSGPRTRSRRARRDRPSAWSAGAREPRAHASRASQRVQEGEQGIAVRLAHARRRHRARPAPRRRARGSPRSGCARARRAGSRCGR